MGHLLLIIPTEINKSYGEAWLVALRKDTLLRLKISALPQNHLFNLATEYASAMPPTLPEESLIANNFL